MLLAKTAKSRFVLSRGELGVTYAVHLWLVGKRVFDFLLVLIELFRQLSRLKCYERTLVVIVLERGVSHFEHKFQGSSTNKSWRQKTTVPGLSRGVVCIILRLAVLIQYRRVTHTHTHTQTHADKTATLYTLLTAMDQKP